MRRILLFIALIVPAFMFGQSYDALWKQVEKASQNDLPQTEQQVLKKIISKAEKEKAYGHLLPRTRSEVDDKGRTTCTRWCYPQHQIARMIADGSIKKLVNS